MQVLKSCWAVLPMLIRMLLGCTVDPLEHVLRGFRESLLQQAAAALVTPPGANDTNTSRDDFSTDDQ